MIRSMAVVGCTHDEAPAVRAAAVKSLGKLKLPDETLVPILQG